ncbi:MAG: methionyl-tRNA formyltransferase, partial [Opitutales bacterium]
MVRLKIVFMGSDPIVLPLLDSLLADHAQMADLVGVCAQPDRRQGRGMRLHENPVKIWAREHGIEARQPDKPGDEETRWLKA